MDEAARITKNVTKSKLDPAGLFTTKDTTTVASQPQTVDMPDDEATKAARRRKVASMQARGGRASTVLAGDDRLGG